MEHLIRNPIIPGFYPDPSICRVGDTFYMVCSSFELYPGIPVFRSRDLANWEQIGNAMERPEQFLVTANVLAGGVMAPTIRYFNGVFYIINANFCDRGNYIVTATDPAGPWSDPHWLDDVPGIDASLFFDDDGQCYVMGTGNVVPRADGTMDRGIWVAHYDIENFKVVGEPWPVWDCALRLATSPEAPHLYHTGGWYYLLIAEGGTEHYHAVTIARSRTLESWFEGYFGNPILTHRHLGFQYPIDNVGHGDLIDTPDGNWYMVVLASRQIAGCHKNLGRETYIVPVTWERDWPVCAPGTGKVEWTYPADEKLPWTPVSPEPGFDDFDGDRLAMHWCFWGTPHEDFWQLCDSRLTLRLLPRPIARKLRPARPGDAPKQDENVAVIFRRQRHPSFSVTTRMDFTAQAANEAAGLVFMQASNHHLRFERGMDETCRQVVRVVRATTWLSGAPHMPGFESKTTESVLGEVACPAGPLVLKIIEREQDVEFLCGENEHTLTPLCRADAGEINPEIVGGMVGTMLGMFATANGKESGSSAAFDWFLYEGIES